MPIATAGKLGRVALGATNAANDRWKVTFHAVDIPTTNFESTGAATGNWSGQTGVGASPPTLITAEEGITGPHGADGEVSGYYDTQATFIPFVMTNAATIPALFPGVYWPLGGVGLYTNKAAVLSAFGFPSIRILQSVVDVDVNGRVNFAFSFKNNRGFTVPGA